MKQEWKGLGSYGTIGIEVVLSILFGLYGGRWLDGKLGTEPYLTVLGFAFGVAAGGKALWRSWKEMQKTAMEEERREGNPSPLYPKPEVREPQPKVRDEPRSKAPLDDEPLAKSSSRQEGADEPR